uniref:Uncharacterized protein n=1 Tax=Anguilla anguilla TaxID=7936 RepID=A0A0E9WRK3_ANGAN
MDSLPLSAHISKKKNLSCFVKKKAPVWCQKPSAKTLHQPGYHTHQKPHNSLCAMSLLCALSFILRSTLKGMLPFSHRCSEINKYTSQKQKRCRS